MPASAALSPPRQSGAECADAGTHTRPGATTSDGPGRSSDSRRRGDSDPVPLDIREDAKARPGDRLNGLDNRAAELLGLLQCGGDVFDAHEEEHLVVFALTGTDRGVRRTFHAGVDERISRVRAFGRNRPAKQLAEETPGRV